MKKIIIILLVSVVSLQVQAQEKRKSAKYIIEVKGNCKMCKKRIEKACLSTKGVKYAKWNVETKKLMLIINEKKTDIETVEKNIAKAGHDTENVKATQEVYDNLHFCCQYRD